VLDRTETGLDVRQVAERLFLTPGTVLDVLAAATAKARGTSTAKTLGAAAGRPIGTDDALK